MGPVDNRLVNSSFQSNVDFRDREETEHDGLSEARIGSQLNYMSDSLMKLTALVEGLQGHLNPILLPNMEENERSVPFPPRKPSSEMSNMIDDLNSQISRLQCMIGVLTERVQL